MYHIPGLSLLVLGVSAVMLRWCPCDEEYQRSRQQHTSSSEGVHVIYDPPPSYRRSWTKDFERNMKSNPSKATEINGKLDQFYQFADISRPLEGSPSEKRSGTLKSSKRNANKSRYYYESWHYGSKNNEHIDEDLPSFETAIKELNASDLAKIYYELSCDKYERGAQFRVDESSTSAEEIPNTINSKKIISDYSIWICDTETHENRRSHYDLAEVHNILRVNNSNPSISAN